MEKIKEITESEKSIVSECRIGNTDYYVKVFFDLKSEHTLEDIIKRLIIKDITEMSSV